MYAYLLDYKMRWRKTLTLLSSLDDLCLRFSLMSFASLEWLCIYGIGELAELVDMVSELPSTELVLCSLPPICKQPSFLGDLRIGKSQENECNMYKVIKSYV